MSKQISELSTQLQHEKAKNATRATNGHATAVDDQHQALAITMADEIRERDSKLRQLQHSLQVTLLPQ